MSTKESTSQSNSQKLTLGIYGLGRMGLNMANRLLEKGSVNLVAYNRSQDKVAEVVKKGAVGATSVDDLLSKLQAGKRIVWLMLPNGSTTEEAFQYILNKLVKGDIIIDGGNSNFHDSIRRHKEAASKGIEMLDIGVSGGVVAATRGYALMIGGPKSAYDKCVPIFHDLAIAQGYAHVGEDGGSGHYVKMIHNAIEYGMMQAIAEGFDLLEHGRMKNLDLPKISHLWNHGTIVSSFLMEMMENALNKDGKLEYLAPYVEDNGEGRWAAIEAMEHAVPFTVNTYALHARYISRDKNSLAFRALAAMRNEFGGHAIKEGKKQ